MLLDETREQRAIAQEEEDNSDEMGHETVGQCDSRVFVCFVCIARGVIIVFVSILRTNLAISNKTGLRWKPFCLRYRLSFPARLNAKSRSVPSLMQDIAHMSLYETGEQWVSAKKGDGSLFDGFTFRMSRLFQQSYLCDCRLTSFPP